MNNNTLSSQHEPSLSVGFKHFETEGRYSYIVWDRNTRDALVIDPDVDEMDDYRMCLMEERLRVVATLDSRTHGDHFSATHWFRNGYASDVLMSEKTKSLRATRRLADGERFKIGSIEFQVIATPGVTPDSIAVFMPFSGVFFAGDTLWPGSTAPLEFPEADPIEHWKSIQKLMSSLPGETVFFSSRASNERLFSTLQVEQRRNVHLKSGNLEEFVAQKKAEAFPAVRLETREKIQYNVQESPTQDVAGFLKVEPVLDTSSELESDGFASISVHKLMNKLDSRAKDYLFIDVREPSEFAAGHPTLARNIPLSEIAFHLKEFRQKKRIYVLCHSGRRSSIAARTLSYIGFPDVVNVSGGYRAWLQAGNPTE